MKEEALKDYTATVREYDFTETDPIQVPFRLVLRSATGAADNMLKTSTVMWSIRALALDLMRTRFFHPLLFTIEYHAVDLYGGVLTQIRATELPGQAINAGLAPAPSFSKTATSLDTKPLQDGTNYEVHFRFLGSELSRFQIFAALLSALLQLAPSDAGSIQPQFGMQDEMSMAWIYMSQVLLPAPGYRFQQYHAVALLDAVARYYVLHRQYQEMVFELRMDGYLTATGCVVKGINARRWCNFPVEGNGTEIADPVAFE
ncbi:MAG: hypothetical protein Q9221_009110 [Calogaya cf. arnoldii]